MQWIKTIGIWGVSASLWAAQTIYCPANHTYISVGMTQADVIDACGQPTSKKTSDEPLTKKIPVLQLIYNNVGTQKAFYGVWVLPVGVEQGLRIEVDVIDNKVHAVRVNGEDKPAFSICGGAPIVEGDPVSKVYAACGNPSTINDTYITQVVSWTEKPEEWVYNFPYQASMRLIFINGKLASIR